MEDDIFKDFKEYTQFHNPGGKIEDFKMSQAGLRNTLEKRLEEGWVIILGLVEDVEPLENYAFKPGTAENRNLEVFLFKTNPTPTAVFFARKTLMFKTYLQDKFSLTQEEITQLQMIFFVKREACMARNYTMDQIFNIASRHLNLMRFFSTWDEFEVQEKRARPLANRRMRREASRKK